MLITLHISSLLTIIAITITLMLSFLLYFLHKGNQRANKVLSLILGVSSFLALLDILNNEQATSSSLLYSIYSLQLIIGPSLYFYTRLMTQANFKWHIVQLWHILPIILSFIIWQLQPGYYLSNGIESINCYWVTNNCSILYQGRFIHRFAAIISALVYLTASLHTLRAHQKNIKNSYSAIEEVNLNWLNVYIYTMFTLTLWALLFEIYINITGALNKDTSGLSVYSSIPLLTSLFIGSFGLFQRKILLEHVIEEDISFSPAATNKIKKYKTSSLTEEGAKNIWVNLQKYMLSENPHLEASLKVSDLAQKIDVPTNHLSETINGYAKQSFYEFINQHRIEEASRLLRGKEFISLSITDIGYQSGFNSNSTFFSHFKKIQGKTPREYRQEVVNA
jgi:AraC-like DNA-binding protein